MSPSTETALCNGSNIFSANCKKCNRNISIQSSQLATSFFSFSIFYHLLWLKCHKSWLGCFFAIIFKWIIFVTKFHNMTLLLHFHWNIVCLFWYKKVSWSGTYSANIFCIGLGADALNWVGHLSPDSCASIFRSSLKLGFIHIQKRDIVHVRLSHCLEILFTIMLDSIINNFQVAWI